MSTPVARKPEWLKVAIPAGETYHKLRAEVRRLGLNTVCEEARCPNIGECWSHGTATLMVMGDTCTRGCRFCHVNSGRPAPLDPDEPRRVGEQVAGAAAAGLDYIVMTSVDRDDVADGGAAHFAACIRAVRSRAPSVLVEVLTPDFGGNVTDVETVLDAGPVVFAQNQETVRRLTHPVRDRRASYDTTLAVLAHAKRVRPHVFTKSSFMVGLGETLDELDEAMDDLRAVGVDIVTFGQYLRPGEKYLAVERYWAPAEFADLEQRARAKGFAFVAAGPLVRSSYRAGELFVRKTLEAAHLGGAARA